MVPETSYSQHFAGEKMTGWIKDKKARRYISKIYQDSGIDTRFSVIPDFGSDAPEVFFKLGEDGFPIEPGTAQRNEIYVHESKKMLVAIADKIIGGCPGIERADITHVITVSCTGFYNPGPDLQIIQGLGLKESTERYNIGFMGCYGAFPAMRMAKQFCQANPDAVVLVVCLEYCSLHLQLDSDLDSIVANSVFADGASALLISAKPPMDKKSLKLDAFASALVTEGAEDMAWTIGDRGFDIVLSKYVPKIIGANISDLVNCVLEQNDINIDSIDLWAVHPGGKSILDKIEQGLELAPSQLADSRYVLRNYGNMSSATVLFVLKEMIEKSTYSKICAIAFGPGLSVESALLTINEA
jgi:predicted naringenin-chalcone synthase